MGNTECSLKLYLDLVMLQGFNLPVYEFKKNVSRMLVKQSMKGVLFYYGVGEKGGGVQPFLSAFADF